MNSRSDDGRARNDGRARDDGRARRARLPAAARRETILAAAREVFGEAGYRAAKVAEVAARVGVSEPVIFQNFGSKAALFAAVVERAAADLRASLEELAGWFGSASGLLRHVVAGPEHGLPGHGRREAGRREEGRREAGRREAGRREEGRPHAAAGPAVAACGALFADAATLAGEPELTGPACAAARAVAAHLADLIRNAQAEGGIRPDADPEAGAWLLLSVISTRRLRAAAMPAGLEPVVAGLALAALACPEGP